MLTLYTVSHKNVPLYFNYNSGVSRFTIFVQVKTVYLLVICCDVFSALFGPQLLGVRLIIKCTCS